MLQAWPDSPKQLDLEQAQDAASHGLQRWHQGYRLREVTVNGEHLQLVLLAELERYARTRPAEAIEAMAIARRVLIELCVESISDSTSQYFSSRSSKIRACATSHGP